MPDAVMIFAAGLGTRMGALTQNLPKPMIPVAGRPLIDHALAQIDRAETVVVNLFYHADILQAHLRSAGTETIVETERLETGGGLRQALPLLGTGPVFTLNSDAVWTGALATSQLRAAWDPERMDALLLLVAPQNAHGHSGGGDFLIDDQKRLRRGAGLIYTGAQIIKTELLQDIPERAFSLNLLWDQMLARDRVFGLEHQGQWCDVGRPESIKIAETLLETHDV
ncbi:nucleotidyltransferase family protein [Candidatus Halocynthiibacter alkanivorans]|uniref:nucleotidyltransferase family protein n=1 Tax=Candidatus Halocynthiibacter alkanivorans TaxID=2267619 RepID=UPI000DF41EFE|nr:nucleotidyltransferase family protein [Candidatus Halocynthiibacter alkanivorans]